MFVSPKFVTALAGLALALTSGAALAEDFQSNGRTKEVYHGDLDLTKADQQKELHSRLARAASRVCSSTNLHEQQLCKAKAMAHVAPRMSAAIARAETKERYADARGSEPVRPVVGN